MYACPALVGHVCHCVPFYYAQVHLVWRAVAVDKAGEVVTGQSGGTGGLVGTGLHVGRVGAVGHAVPVQGAEMGRQAGVQQVHKAMHR
jgi:hypothetical protein